MTTGDSTYRGSRIPALDGVYPKENVNWSFLNNPSYKSGIIDMSTGAIDENELTLLRERALYDPRGFSRAPAADFATGPVFPGAVQAITGEENTMRPRTTVYRGPQQLGVTGMKGEEYLNSHFHPHGYPNEEYRSGPWYAENKNGFPFKGYPNPDLFSLNLDATPVSNVQNLTYSQVRDALESGTSEAENWDQVVSKMMLNERMPTDYKKSFIEMETKRDAKRESKSHGNGVHMDPRKWKQLNQEFQVNFDRTKSETGARQMASAQRRRMDTGPGSFFQYEQKALDKKRMAADNAANNKGIAYNRPLTYHV